MLTGDQISEIQHIVSSSLDAAEEVWQSHGKELVVKAHAADEAFMERAEIVPSRIPNHELVNGDKPEIDEFIALVADMRSSSTHLLCAISEKTAKVSQLQRVYYETSALLPAFERTVSFGSGVVTEYLGDGILALFAVDPDKKMESVKMAYRAADNCIACSLKIVNDELYRRYSLPKLQVGIGLSYSRALVHLVGIAGERHPKVIGSCVYHASKLSGGINIIAVDEPLREAWTSSKGGNLRFSKKSIRGVNGYVIEKMD